MKVVLAEKILKLLGLEKVSENYQTVYKVESLLLQDLSDAVVLEEAIKRGMVSEKCAVCGKKMERIYSSNEVLDSFECLQKH